MQLPERTLPPLPLLPLRNLVVLPQTPLTLVVGRERSMEAIRQARKGDGRVLLAPQQEGQKSDPSPADIHSIGTLATIEDVLPLPEGTLRVLVQGVSRARIVSYLHESPFFLAQAELLADPAEDPARVSPTMQSVKQALEAAARTSRTLTPDVLLHLSSLDDPSAFSWLAARNLPSLSFDERLALLDAPSALARLERLLHALTQEPDGRGRPSRARRPAERSERSERPDAEPGEPAERDEFRAELAELTAKIQELPLSPQARERAQRELRKLKQMSPMGAEATVIRTWLEWVLALPWGKRAEEHLDLTAARDAMDRAHFGLRRVKRRLLELLAVAKLTGRVSGAIVCLVGPPGVGKTTLARAMAEAIGRPFVRISLGGVRDEAEIRGHRRTYIGALPGRVLQAIRRAGVSNPVILLDEIDKITSDYRGDPSAALLEVLDPEQNKSFSDHYVELDVDLSSVLFLCTANRVEDIPLPLLDRLELLPLPSYTPLEKERIALGHLLPRQRALHGLTEAQLQITRPALRALVLRYTKEAGVRNLERLIASLCRRVAQRVVLKGPEVQVVVRGAHLQRWLGPPPYRARKLPTRGPVGAATGLAWTATGGVVVPIEAAALPGSGKTTMTGQLGAVFKESAEAAITWLRANADRFGLPPGFAKDIDLHLHVPELWGVDGPSAGVTLATAVISAVCRLPTRPDVAMTGELTLQGEVRAIGGVREKLLAAWLAGAKVVLLPEENLPDLQRIPKKLQKKLHILPVKTVEEVLRAALVLPPDHPLLAPPS